jgi:Heterokaryon incompatibility protein (HET)
MATTHPRRLSREHDEASHIRAPAGTNPMQVEDQVGESMQLQTDGTSTIPDRPGTVYECQVAEDITRVTVIANDPEVERVLPNTASPSSPTSRSQSFANFSFEVDGRFVDYNGLMEILNAQFRQFRDQMLAERAMDFQYEPLNPSRNYIRVLDLMPGSFNDAFQCSLRTVLLDDRPTYQALSYTWGEAVTTATLFINERDSMRITRNLDEALRHVRSESEMKTLWIDAVCIDQRNDVEKADQVRKMLEVYRSAEQVLVWLGPNADNSDLAVDLIERMPTFDFDRLRSALTDIDLREWAALKALYRRPWWRRIWVRPHLLAKYAA